MFHIFKKTTLRKRVLILSALPETETDFISLCSVGSSDFILSLKSKYKSDKTDDLWKYYKPTAQHLSTTLDFIKEKGGVVVHNFDLSNFRLMVDYDYVVLLAHHSDISDEIEIGGRLVRTHSIIESIPHDCKLVFDITSCYSAYLIPRVKARIPNSKIIGIDIATSLDIRLDALYQIARSLCKEMSVLDAVKDGWNHVDLTSAPSDIKLGSKLKSSIYAPCEVSKGEDFIISIFIHKPENEDEVTIMARAIDDDAQVRNTLPIKTKLKKGDSIDFQLCCKGFELGFFAVDETNKSIVWDGEIESVEFIVSVFNSCQSSSFVGKIIMAINSEKIGDMSFKIKIGSALNYEGAIPCAPIELKQTDKQAVMDEQKGFLLDKLLKHRNAKENDPDRHKEVDMCNKCIELLQEYSHSQNNDVLKVFISSTSDMSSYRNLIKECVLKCEMYPEMYEMWGLEDKYPRDMCVQHVLNSDIFVCILGANYGFVEPAWDMSMTEIEYRTAVVAGLPILIYIDANYRKNTKNLSQNAQSLFKRQETLIEELKFNSVVYIFDNSINLEIKSIKELSDKKYLIRQ